MVLAVCLPTIEGVDVELTEPKCSVPVAAVVIGAAPICVVWIVKSASGLVVPIPNLLSI